MLRLEMHFPVALFEVLCSTLYSINPHCADGLKVYHVYPEGWKAISLTDVYDLHYEYQDGPKPALK